MYELKKVGAKTLARVTSFVGAVIYILFGIIALVTGTGSIGNGIVTLAVGFVLFALFGAAFGALVAWFYNFAARRWGGMHLDFALIEQVEADDDADKEADAGQVHQDAP